MANLPTRLIATCALTAILSCWLLITAAASAADLSMLRQQWREAGDEAGYQAVAQSLIAYRVAARYAKTAEIDYMIATSLCRVVATEKDGFRHFEWILANYDLGPDRQKVVDEQARCRRSPTVPTRVAFTMLPGQGGAAEIRSKLYYWLGREEAAVNTEPVKIVAPMAPKELSARLFAYGDEQAATRAAAARLKNTPLASNFTFMASSGFVMASSAGHSDVELRRVAENLKRFVNFFVAAYRLRQPDQLITVYLVSGVTDFGKLATALHGIEVPRQTIGYSFRDDLSILAIIPGQAIGTLGHELFHMLVRERYGDLPPWLEEGAASLYEVSNVSPKFILGGHIDAGPGGPPLIGGELAVRGVTNWRGCVLKRLWLQNYGGMDVARPTLTELVAMDWRAFNNLEGDELVARQAVIHATARYFLLYLQDVERKLFDVFSDFADRDPFQIELAPTEDARARLAARLGDLAGADRRFEGWLRATINTQECSG